MDKRLLALGLIGGTLALVGFFTPWVAESGLAEGFPVSIEYSGRDLTTIGRSVRPFWLSLPTSVFPYLALSGGALSLIGALAALAPARIRRLDALLLVGGLSAVVGAGWGFTATVIGHFWAFDVELITSHGYGLYLCLIGGILSFIAGALLMLGNRLR